MTKNKTGNFGKFLLLWAGELISSIGGGLTSFGLGVYIFQKTGSAASMALVMLLAAALYRNKGMNDLEQ